MKQPRTTDFDPKAAEQERQLRSSMENFPAIVKPTTTQAAAAPMPAPQQTKPLDNAPKRQIRRRHPFDVYEDQVVRLKQLSLKAQANGGVGSMSEMVREALDDYLKKRSK